MTTSEVVMSIVAIRLAALLLAGLILQALPARPPATVQVVAIGATTQHTSTATPLRSTRDGTDESLRDMLLHD
jgi:hypothetical protein